MIIQGTLFITLAMLLLYFPPENKVVSSALILIFGIVGVYLILLSWMKK